MMKSWRSTCRIGYYRACADHTLDVRMALQGLSALTEMVEELA